MGNEEFYFKQNVDGIRADNFGEINLILVGSNVDYRLGPALLLGHHSTSLVDPESVGNDQCYRVGVYQRGSVGGQSGLPRKSLSAALEMFEVLKGHSSGQLTDCLAREMPLGPS